MTRTLIADLGEHVEEQVTIRGWVQVVRDQKRMQFLVIRDESGSAQAILGKDDPPSALNEEISALAAESAVTVTGKVVADERVKLGGLELQLDGLTVDSPAEPELPIAADSALDKRIDWRYLDLRRPDRRLIFEVQSTVEHAMREFWRKEGFIEIHTPKLMGSASESGAELFKVEYFERHRLPRPVAPVLQADGDGRRLRQGVRDRPRVPRQPLLHLAPRHRVHQGRRGALVDRLARGRNGLRGGAGSPTSWRRSSEAHGAAIEATFATELVVPTVPFPRVTLDQAKEMLRERGHESVPAPATTSTRPASARFGADRQGAHGHEFAFVTEYPTSVRPFYHMRFADDPTVTKSFDLLWRASSSTTGAQREHRYEQLLAQAAREGRRDRPDPVLPRLLPLRRAAARRLRVRAHAAVDAAARAGKRARGHVPLSRAPSPGAVGRASPARGSLQNLC